MAVIAYFGLLAGFLGLAAIVGTLWQTSKAAKAASSTLGIAKKSMRLEMQPYLSCEGIKIRERTRVEGHEVQTHQLFIIKNNGKTPAYVSGSKTNVIASLTSVEPASKSKDIRGRAHQSWYIPPNGEVSIPMFTKYAFERLEGGKVEASQITIRGRVDIFYSDEFTPDGRELRATFEYNTGDISFNEGVGDMVVGNSYSITENDKP